MVLGDKSYLHNDSPRNDPTAESQTILGAIQLTFIPRRLSQTEEHISREWKIRNELEITTGIEDIKQRELLGRDKRKTLNPEEGTKTAKGTSGETSECSFL